MNLTETIMRQSGGILRFLLTEAGRAKARQSTASTTKHASGRLNRCTSNRRAGVQETASLKGRPFLSEPAGPRSLCQLVSLVTVLEAAQIVLSAHSQGGGPDARVVPDDFGGA